MSVFILKLIAMGSMVIDHLGYSYFFGNQLMRLIGRLAFIIYAFLIAEGYYHLKKKPSRLKGHLIKIFILCLITEPLFDYFDHGKWINLSTQSSLITLISGFLALIISGWWQNKNKDSPCASFIGTVVIFCVMATASYLLRGEYKFAGVLLIGMFYLYLCKADNMSLPKKMIVLEGIIIIYIGIYLWSRSEFGNVQAVASMAERLRPRIAGMLVSILPIAFYNRKLGYHSKWFSWLYSIFYPLQFVVLLVARYFIRGF